jgi:hypothetical protein
VPAGTPRTVWIACLLRGSIMLGDARSTMLGISILDSSHLYSSLVLTASIVISRISPHPRSHIFCLWSTDRIFIASITSIGEQRQHVFPVFFRPSYSNVKQDWKKIEGFAAKMEGVWIW